MEHASLDKKLQRIEECAAGHSDELFRRSLLHAYVGCLDDRELLTATLRTINSPVAVRKAIRTRLVRIGNSGKNQKVLDEIANEFLSFADPPRKERDRQDSLLSVIYPYLSSAQRSKILNRWRDRGNKSSLDRWLKAVENDQEFLSIEEIEKIWRWRKQFRAVKILAQKASPEHLERMLPELIEENVEGWIINRAALRARKISIDSWANIRTNFPATFIYLCFKMGYNVSESDAYQIIIDQSQKGDIQQTGLAVWAVGQLQMWDVLETIRHRSDLMSLIRLERSGI